jgi:molybdopterin converting factor small subunit
MRIRIEISSVLHPLIPVSENNLSDDQWEVPERAHTGTILTLLGLDQVPTMLIVNKTPVTGKTFLAEGDVVRIFPMVSGG